jgi:predicted thioredoxin/glutaredoxin
MMGGHRWWPLVLVAAVGCVGVKVMPALMAGGQASVGAAANIMHDAPLVANKRERAPGMMRRTSAFV